MIWALSAAACVLSFLIGYRVGLNGMLKAAMNHRRAMTAKMDLEQRIWLEALSGAVLDEAKRAKR